MAQAAEKAPGGHSFSTGYEYDGETTAAGCGSAPTGASQYLLAGRLTMVGNTAATVKYQEYDGIGRVKQSRREMAGGGPWQFAYSYNHQGLISMTYPSGRVVTTGYDNGGRPNSVANYVTNVTYHAHGAPDQTTLANTLVETAVYNNRLQPTQITAGSLLNLSFSYGTGNNNGNVLSQTIAGLGVTQTYTYDFVNRISSASETGAGTPWSQSYSYTTDGSDGRFGNLSQTGDGLSALLLCGSYYTATNRCADSGFDYDNAGNLTVYANRTLTYDAENRQTTLSDGGSYEYDGEGRRVKKIAEGVITMYVYDAFGELAAEYASAAPAHQPDCARCYLTPDHVGSVRLVTDETGAVKRRYDYCPFGWEINSGYGNRSTVTGYVTTDWSNPKFTGHPRDYESGLNLDYFGARYFSAAQGRFTSPDPVFFQAGMLTDPQRFNLYAYVRNNPLRFVDPKGEAIELTGTDEERAKKLAAIQSKLAEAGKYLYDNVYKGKHYVGIYTNGQDGKGPAFASINDATKALSQIITDKAVATINLAQEGSKLVSGNGRVLATMGSIDVASGKGPGSTRRQGDGTISTTILAPGLSTGVLPGPMMSNGLPGQTDTGLVLWHELGHVLGLMSGEIGPQTNERADDLENTVRRLKNPSAPVRMMHDPPPGVR